MLVVWGVFILVNIVLVYIFGFGLYPAIYRMLCDFIYRVIKKDEIPVFNMYGVYLFCGRVGTGKTISMVNEARRIKKRYPNVKIMANFYTDVADGYISSWEDVYYSENIDDNGVNQGILFLFDEIHLTFDSQSWKNAPANLLEYVSLQRHLHKCIFGSSQVWTRVNKIIREQTDFIVECRCFFGKRLVRNVCYSQEEYQINGDLKDSGMRKRKSIYHYAFFASDKLRALYDTDEIVGALGAKIGVTRAEKKAMEYDTKE